jgi:hypothetical protein
VSGVAPSRYLPDASGDCRDFVRDLKTMRAKNFYVRSYRQLHSQMRIPPPYHRRVRYRSALTACIFVQHDRCGVNACRFHPECL